MLRIHCILALLVGLTGPLAAADDAVAGWRGDGTGVFPDARPPLAWSAGLDLQLQKKAKRLGHGKGAFTFTRTKRVQNLAWMTPLPSWSNATPVVVGDQVMVMSEPLDYAPEVIALAVDDGSIRWRQTIDHLALLPAGRQQEVRAFWSRCWSMARLAARLCGERRAIKRMQESGDPQAAQALAEWQATADAAGLGGMDINDTGFTGVAAGKDWPPAELKQGLKGLEAVGCHFNTWEIGIDGKRGEVALGGYVGYTHPTPVSDGEHLYVFTGYNSVACLDVDDGAIRWLRFLGEEAIDEKRGWVSFAQSPILVDGTLLIGTDARLTGVDARTGNVRWVHEIAKDERPGGKNELFTGCAVEVDGAAWFFWIDGRLYRAADGRPYGERIAGDERVLCTSSAAWDQASQTLLFLTYGPRQGKHSPVVLNAVGLSRAGSALRHERRWRLVCDQTKDLDHLASRPRIPMPTVHKQRVYCLGRIIDLATGAVQLDGLAPAEVTSGYTIAGEHLFTVTSDRKAGHAIVHVSRLDGSLVGRSALPSEERSGERLDQVREWTGRDHWHQHWHGAFHAGLAFSGDRMFVRSRDGLFCLRGR